MSARALIIDCDPGLDDAVALLLALASPDEIELLGVTAVAGNAALAHCSRNARQICELAGRGEIGVYAGCPRPMVYPLLTAPEVHGETGIGRARLPAPRTPLRNPHAVNFLIDTLRERDDVTLCPIGPLTNIALALVQAPDIAPRIRELVIMGGAMARGNVTPAAEFNFYVDPHAARVVCESGVPVTLFGLDVTHTVLVTPERLAALRATGGAVADAVGDMLGSLPLIDNQRFGGAPLHDPCAVAYLLRPELFAGKDCFVEIVVDAGPARGQSVVDWWGGGGREPNARVIDRADAGGFFALLGERLARL